MEINKGNYNLEEDTEKKVAKDRVILYAPLELKQKLKNIAKYKNKSINKVALQIISECINNYSI